ncbi:MAG: hypothetical protein RLN89_05130 [Parvibaculum sp.]
MNDRMIFFPHKRRTNLRLVAKLTGLTALTVAIFLAGLQVGVRMGAKHAAMANSQMSLVTVSLASDETTAPPVTTLVAATD